MIQQTKKTLVLKCPKCGHVYKPWGKEKIKVCPDPKCQKKFLEEKGRTSFYI